MGDDAGQNWIEDEAAEFLARVIEVVLQRNNTFRSAIQYLHELIRALVSRYIDFLDKLHTVEELEK